MSLVDDYFVPGIDAVEDDTPIALCASVIINKPVMAGYARVDDINALDNVFQNIFGDAAFPNLREASRNFKEGTSLVVAVTPSFADNHMHEIHVESTNSGVDAELCLLRKSHGPDDQPPAHSVFIFAVDGTVKETNFWVVGPDDQDTPILPDSCRLQPYPDTFLMAPRSRPGTGLTGHTPAAVASRAIN